MAREHPQSFETYLLHLALYGQGVQEVWRLGTADRARRAHSRANNLLVGVLEKARDVREAAAVRDCGDCLESRQHDPLPRVVKVSVENVEGPSIAPECFEDPVRRDDCVFDQLAARRSRFRLQCLNGIAHSSIP